ncbi:hypothetical protein L873DRAFT_1802488, partial [Choiromyces venosus 120613-1]
MSLLTPPLTLLYLLTLTPLLLITPFFPLFPLPTYHPPLRPCELLLYVLLLSIILSCSWSTAAPNSCFNAPCCIFEYYLTWSACFALVIFNAHYIQRRGWVLVFIYNAICGGPWVMFVSRLGVEGGCREVGGWWGVGF